MAWDRDGHWRQFSAEQREAIHGFPVAFTATGWKRREPVNVPELDRQRVIANSWVADVAIFVFKQLAEVFASRRSPLMDLPNRAVTRYILKESFL